MKMFQDLLTNPIYLGIGASLGFVVALVQIYEFLKKGAKVSAVILLNEYTGKPRVTTETDSNNVKTVVYSSSVLIKLQLQNAGTELTSITSASLILPNQTAAKSKVKKLTNFSSGTQFSFLSTDERTIVLESGIAVVEDFYFNIDLTESEYKTVSPCELILRFVNHSDLKIEVSFQPKTEET
jgi:hypothetical protein